MPEPEMSIVLPTDTYATIRPVIECLCRQTVRDRIELVLVAPPGAVDAALAYRDDFAGIRIVEDPVADLAPARAAGVHAASAEWVFIGETHTYPQPGWAEALLTAFNGPWAAVVPAIGNANPKGAASWASYLFDYGAWGPNRHSGEIADPLIYNTAYRREVLLSLGDSLPAALDPSEEALWPLLMSLGHRAALASDARILHLNVGTFRTLIREKFCVGVVVGTHRSARWSPLRRLLYFVASPLIPIVLFGRVLRGARHWPSDTLPTSTIPGVLIAALAKTAGEIIGYAGVKLPAAAARLQDIEIRKVRYAGVG